MLATEQQFPPPPGTLLAGKYTVVRTIGRGGMAFVLEARHEGLDSNVAVKVLHPDFRLDEEATSRFQREARAVAKLTSNHVARVIDVDALEDGTPFMVLELLKGLDLGQELVRRGPLPIHEAVRWVIEACRGMRDAHRAGVVHRDLKPANLFLADTPGGRSVKILDFGISKMVSGDPSSRMTTTQSAFGTPLYMSPEQVRSVKDVDSRTDIWSLGVILYEALTCRAPFEQASASALFVSISVDQPRAIEQHRPELPRGLILVLLKALEKQPEDRYADVGAFAAALEPYSTPEGILDAALDPAPVSRAAPAEGARRRTALVVAACVVAAVAAVATAIQLRGPARDAAAETAAPIVREPSATAAAEPTSIARPEASIEPHVTPEPTGASEPAGASPKPPPPKSARPVPAPSVSAAPAPPSAKPEEPPSPPPDDPKYL